MKSEAKIESLLYTAGEEGISIQDLMNVLELQETEILEMIHSLNNHYANHEFSGLTVLDIGDRFILATKKEAEPYVKKYAQTPFMTALSKAALEILAIVTYRQPLTRMEIDTIRGVQSGSSLQKLVLRGLVEEKGRVEGPGRPLLYGTTDYFLNYFGLKTLKDLPKLPEEHSEQIKEMDLFYNTITSENESPNESNEF